MSQLGMVTPFFHKKCGGEVTQQAKPNSVEAYPGHGPQLQYYCAACKLFLELKDVMEKTEKTQVKDTTPGPNKPGTTPPLMPPVTDPSTQPAKPGVVTPATPTAVGTGASGPNEPTMGGKP